METVNTYTVDKSDRSYGRRRFDGLSVMRGGGGNMAGLHTHAPDETKETKETKKKVGQEQVVHQTEEESRAECYYIYSYDVAYRIGRE